jgi:hypothetical protein
MSVKGAVNEATESRVVQHVARAGYPISGVLHLLIAYTIVGTLMFSARRRPQEFLQRPPALLRNRSNRCGVRTRTARHKTDQADRRDEEQRAPDGEAPVRGEALDRDTRQRGRRGCDAGGEQ